MKKIERAILEGWNCYQKKVAFELLKPENEKMMQLQLAQIYQTIMPIYEYEETESIRVLLEVPVIILDNVFRSIDLVILHIRQGIESYYPIELKCFRRLTRDKKGKRGAQNIGMYDYWEDIENIENYSLLDNFASAFQFTLTDDPYYVTTEHQGPQVSMFSTYSGRDRASGRLTHHIANRKGDINLIGSYSMASWRKINGFNFISQKAMTARDAAKASKTAKRC
jgi:hypothetical protein